MMAAQRFAGLYAERLMNAILPKEKNFVLLTKKMVNDIKIQVLLMIHNLLYVR